MRHFALAASLLAPSTHQAAAAPPAETTAPAYCAINAVTGQSSCVADAAHASEARRAVNVGAEAVEPAGRSAAPAAADVLVGRLYGALNYGGDMYEIFFNRLCNTSSAVDWLIPNLTGFQDVTSSFRGYASCKIQIWENPNYGGATLGPLAASSYVGDALNDRASAIKGS